MNKVVFSIVCLAFFLTGCAKNSEKVETPIEPAQEMLNETALEGSAVTVSATVPVAVAETVATATTPLQNAMISEEPTNEGIQKALKNAGLYEGKIDGTIGPKSKKAIEDFQAKNDLIVDGKVGPKTWEKMKQYLVASAAQSSEAVSVQQ